MVGRLVKWAEKAGALHDWLAASQSPWRLVSRRKHLPPTEGILGQFPRLQLSGGEKPHHHTTLHAKTLFDCYESHCKLNKLAFGFIHQPSWPWLAWVSILGPNHLWDNMWVWSGVDTPRHLWGLWVLISPSWHLLNFWIRVLALDPCLPLSLLHFTIFQIHRWIGFVSIHTICVVWINYRHNFSHYFTYIF